MLNDNVRHQHLAPNQQLLVSLLQLCVRLIQSNAPTGAGHAAASTAGRLFDESGSSSAGTLCPDGTSSDYEVASNESLTDETKQQQLQQNAAASALPPADADEAMDQGSSTATLPAAPSVADNVLQHQPTMTRLLTSLTQCSGSSLTMLMSSVHKGCDLDEDLYDDVADIAGTWTANQMVNNVSPFRTPSWTKGSMGAGNGVGGGNSSNASGHSPSDPSSASADLSSVSEAVFQVLILLAKRASTPNMIINPLYQFLKSSESYSIQYLMRFYLYLP